VAQSQTLLRTTRQSLETIFASTGLSFPAAGMRRRIDAVMPYGEVFLRTVDQLIGNFRHRKLLAVVAGVAGLVLILILLLEISVRIELSKEAGNAAIDATAAPSPSEQKVDVGHVLTLQPTNSSWLQSADQEGATGTVPFLGPQTFVQVLGLGGKSALATPRSQLCCCRHGALPPSRRAAPMQADKRLTLELNCQSDDVKILSPQQG
jgi:hypothetical protein